MYRKGQCADNLSNYMGENVDVKKGKSYKFGYFLRTSNTGGNIGDTSNVKNYTNDFVYNRDNTCGRGGSKIRKTFLKSKSLWVTIFNFF